ncbi:MAG: tripartite tricarboxylate transporter substrate binding protein [Burkholderiales bacterium]|nr:tripartite tricarboxylate transporter substrate binding protein [Burkholderiales bacterium]
MAAGRDAAPRRARVLGAIGFALVAGSAAHAATQTYPAKPVRLIVSFSAGSGSDTIGRLIARGLTQALGQQVIVDNRAGAAGNIGAELAARAPADGYALLLVNMGHAANAIMYKNLGYDLRRDFAPVMQIASSPSVVVLHPSVPAKTLPEFVKLAKARPGDIAYCSGGVGTPTFVAGELFKHQAGVNLLHVPYRSGGEAITAVLAGEVSVYFAPMATALPNIRQARLRALAVTSSKRVPVLSDYPTVAEMGYPGYQAGNWYGLAAPAKTAQEVIAAIRGAALNALRTPEINKALTDLGYVVIADEPDDFAAHIQAEIDKLSRILRDIRVQ